MPFEKRITLPGSEKRVLPGSQPIGPIPPDEKVCVTLILRRGGTSAVPNTAVAGQHLSREEFAARHGADPADIALAEKFAHQFQLTVVESSAAKRRVVLMGTAESMSEAFGVEFACYRIEQTGHSFRGRSGFITIPAELENVVIAVLGLDNRPIAKPHICRRKRVAPSAPALLSCEPSRRQLEALPRPKLPDFITFPAASRDPAKPSPLSS